VLTKFLGWDLPSKLALASCALAGLVPFLVGAATGGTSETSEWWEWMLFPVSFALLLPFLAAPQIVLLLLIKHTDYRWLKWALLGASLLLIGRFAAFLMTADLTANSTAPLAAMFYPLRLALISAVIGGAVVILIKRRRVD
jgi:hypothetical protein